MAAFRRDGGPPDVLLSDIAMPGEDGNTLIRRIRRLSGPEGGGVPAVALTAYARADDRDRAMAAGYQVHVPKPVEPAKLLQVVADLLRDARAHDAFNAGPSRL
jgi:CheY-like chemotaxis protein